MHWFGFCCLGCLGGLRGNRRGKGEVLSSGTRPENVYVFDFATPQLRRVGTGGSYLQVDFLNPPR